MVVYIRMGEIGSPPMRIRKRPSFRFSYRRNVIINDIESRNFLGIWQDNEIVISLPAILDDSLSEVDMLTDDYLVRFIGGVIAHEYLHHVIYWCKHDEGHHHIIDRIL